MRGKNFLIAALLASGYFFSACSDRTVATTDQDPAADEAQTVTTESIGAGADPANNDDVLTREDVATTGQGIDTETMSAGNYDATVIAELPNITQQLVIPMQDMLQQMEGVELEERNVDQSFAQLMIYHHQGAINMAHQVMQSGDNAEISNRARQMITTKQQEIDRLQQFAANSAGTTTQQMGTTGTTGASGTVTGTTSAEPKEQLKNATEGTMGQLLQENLNGDADHDFAHIMILHHQDAIEMAEVEMQFGENPEVKAIAEQIIQNNRQQIQELDAWRTSNDG
ncbi:DUF305 domain-containing protein [Cesiribacter sp. SM1]|uniref:DUF305 domain-containing protein n=1 Tax=Cesiribacter sp. SM1 TaxID=2861196 RepID=UPI001CD1A4BF|nr:DUF305 domain-containing protein [Cesiribacter sp. SM1]